MQDAIDDLVVTNIMTSLLADPKEVMNMGLACRRWYYIARMLLLNTPQARGVRCLTDAYRLGWPCVITYQLSMPCNSEAAKFPGMEIIGACIGRNKRQLRYIRYADARAVQAFLMGTHDRLGSQSPVPMLSHWLVRTISSLVTNNATVGF